jgi:hypothetical protein
MTDLSKEAQDAVRRVEKLLRLAAKNKNENEAAAAAAKAQEILAAYNLDMATVEANSGASSGKREDAKTKGGLYHYQRDLWEALADLNFCMYWNMYSWDKTKRRRRKSRYTGEWEVREGGYRFEHRLVGRTVNTALTRTMAQYLEQTIERLTRERLNDEGSQFFTRWAISYREGLADTIIGKIYERRKHVLAAELRRQKEDEKRARDAATAGMSLSTALTLADVRKSEQQANYDFLHGDGAWARKEARMAEWKKERAEAQAREEANYTAWAAANPDEARKLEEQERKRRVSYGPKSYREKRDDKRDWGAFRAGREDGKKVGIDPQTDVRAAGRLK